MNTIPVLIIEDEDSAIEYLDMLLKEISENLGLTLAPSVFKDFRDGKEQVELGIYPLVIVDLDLPDPLAGEGQDKGPYIGLQLVELVRQHNKDALVCLYTGYYDETKLEVFDCQPDQLLLKKEMERDTHISRLQGLLNQLRTKFNYTVNPDVGEALRQAFGDTPPQISTEKWEICLRRLLRDARSQVKYDYIGRGYSGAGIAAVWPDEYLPKVLKFQSYQRLEDELRRFQDYVLPYVPKKTITSRDDLAQAGEAGILAYSLVGLASDPRTLASSIVDPNADADKIALAVCKHFATNCERWFDTRGRPKPHDLASQCRNHFHPTCEKIRTDCARPPGELAVQAAAKYIWECTARELVNTINEAIEAEREKVYCRPEATVHGDLNARNLVYQDGELWMIDFERTGPNARLLDFVKLEASIKYDVPSRFPKGTSTEMVLDAVLRTEDVLLNSMIPDLGQAQNAFPPETIRKAKVICAIRAAASKQCGRTPEVEYWLSMFFVTAKHVEYLARDIQKDEEKYVPLVHALVSAYRLAKMVEGTVKRA